MVFYAAQVRSLLRIWNKFATRKHTQQVTMHDVNGDILSVNWNETSGVNLPYSNNYSIQNINLFLEGKPQSKMAKVNAKQRRTFL